MWHVAFGRSMGGLNLWSGLNSRLVFGWDSSVFDPESFNLQNTAVLQQTSVLIIALTDISCFVPLIPDLMLVHQIIPL